MTLDILGTYKDEDGRELFRAVVKESKDRSTHGITFTVQEAQGWDCETNEAIYEAMWDDNDGEVACVFMKWDGCSHIGLRDPSLDKNWTHVCGAKSLVVYLKMLVWAWNLGTDYLKAQGHDEPGLRPLDFTSTLTPKPKKG